MHGQFDQLRLDAALANVELREIGSLNRLGPALPGFKYSTPFTRSAFGTCE